MNKKILFKVIGIIFLVISILFEIDVAVNESWKYLGYSVVSLIISIVSFILSFRFKKIESSSSSEINQSTDNKQFKTPNVCPHCKNPNGKMLRLCEWCGSQIC